jgi:multidrug efflux pump subunit AcrA (membrane-fusion protein)
VLVTDLASAQAAGEASQAEVKRLQTLAAQNNASQRALQTAEAAAARDHAQVEAARLRLLASWGGAIAQKTDLMGFVQSLGSLAAALVELDVPAGEAAGAHPLGARLVTLSDPTNAVPAEFIGPAPQVDAQFQGLGFLFLVQPNTKHLSPGASVTSWLRLEGEPQTGVALPREAVVQFNGTTWVYLQTAADVFQRTEVALGSPLEDGWFVRRGLKPEDKVVTVGAQELLSEEVKGQLSE